MIRVSLNSKPQRMGSRRAAYTLTYLGILRYLHDRRRQILVVPSRGWRSAGGRCLAHVIVQDVFPDPAPNLVEPVFE